MSVTRLSAAAAPSALRLAGLLVVIAGLFGMHGLASHGVDGMDVVPGTALMSEAMTGSLMHVVDASLVGTVGLETAAIRGAQSVEPSESGHGGMDMSIAMICLAILGAALLALAHRLRNVRSASVVWARRHQVRVTLHSARGLAPPYPMELSIQRC